jgi:hypothetical protein
MTFTEMQYSNLTVDAGTSWMCRNNCSFGDFQGLNKDFVSFTEAASSNQTSCFRSHRTGDVDVMFTEGIGPDIQRRLTDVERLFDATSFQLNFSDFVGCFSL